MSYKLYTDGASRGNGTKNQRAGAGAVIKDSQGNTISEVWEYLGSATNNEAEYHSLIMGIGEVLRLDIRKIDIYMDSNLVCKQVCGGWRVRKEHLKPLRKRVTTLLDKFDHWSLNHIRREFNKDADKLANKALD